MRTEDSEKSEKLARRDGAPHGGPTSSSERRWLRHLAFSAPLVASLVGALLVAGSFALMRWVGGNAVPTRAVPLGRTDIDVDWPIDPVLGRVGTATDELRRQGRIGPEDTLAPSGRERVLGQRVLTRTRQEHRGIPVFAADVVVTTEGDEIIKIHGHPTSDIELDITIPANDYPATVTLAEGLLDQAVVPEDDGELVIVPVEDGGYRLAWLGNVVIDETLEQVALDAETGAVLHRVPVVVNASAGGASPGGGSR